MMSLLALKLGLVLLLAATIRGKSSQDEAFEKLNTGGPVCFSAAGNRPALITYAGTEDRMVGGIKLVYKSGQVSCDGVNFSPWGCSLNKGISIVITDRYGNVIYPRNVSPMKYKHANQPLNITVRSEGCDDPGIKGCGRAFMYINGVDRAQKSRGFHFIVIDRQTGQILSVNAYDTYISRTDAQNAYNFVKGLKGDKIVLAAISDEGWHYTVQFPAIDQEFVRLGATGPFDKGLRSSFALIGSTKSRSEPWIRFVQNARYKGPSVVSTSIPMTGVSSGYWYTVIESNEHSKSLLFTNTAEPFLLRQGGQIKIWYGEDFMDVAEFDNKGQTCVDVYAWFA